MRCIGYNSFTSFFCFFFVDAMENKESVGFCMVCGNADAKPNANLSNFGCDVEHFGSCGTISNFDYVSSNFFITIDTFYFIIRKHLTFNI